MNFLLCSQLFHPLHPSTQCPMQCQYLWEEPRELYMTVLVFRNYIVFCWACMPHNQKLSNDSFCSSRMLVFFPNFYLELFLENCQSCKNSTESSFVPFTQLPPVITSLLHNQNTLSKPGKLIWTQCQLHGTNTTKLQILEWTEL